MTRTKQTPAGTRVAVPSPRAEQLAALRWDWVVVVLQRATDPQIKQVVLETAVRAGRRLHGHGGPVDQTSVIQIAAAAGCPLTTVEAVLEAAARLGSRPKRSAVPQPRPASATARHSENRGSRDRI